MVPHHWEEHVSVFLSSAHYHHHSSGSVLWSMKVLKSLLQIFPPLFSGQNYSGTVSYSLIHTYIQDLGLLFLFSFLLRATPLFLHPVP